jgi:RNA polymerase sigma-70 factor (ECF subfamily)
MVIAIMNNESTTAKNCHEPPSLHQLWSKGWPQTTNEFAELVEVFQDRLVAFAFRRVRNLHDAEDVIQQVLVRAFRDRHKLQHVVHIGPYLYRIAANACIDFLRKKSRQREISLETNTTGQVSTILGASVTLQAQEETDRIETILYQLPKRQAEAIRFRVFDELSFVEIAQILNCSEATVKSRFRYGLEKVKRILERQKENFQ